MKDIGFKIGAAAMGWLGVDQIILTNRIFFNMVEILVLFILVILNGMWFDYLFSKGKKLMAKWL